MCWRFTLESTIAGALPKRAAANRQGMKSCYTQNLGAPGTPPRNFSSFLSGFGSQTEFAVTRSKQTGETFITGFGIAHFDCLS
jgi:hypothetical protein